MPGLQFYTGNFIQVQTGKKGASYKPRCGFALETQYYPDSVNQEAFASPILRAGETFRSETVYKLSRM